MDQNKKTQKVYQAHRENQRERILETAGRLFSKEGIDAVSLSEIAREARLTRPTLYEYFPNKEEIAWAVFQKVVADLGDPSGVAGLNTCASGYAKIEWLFFHSIHTFRTFTDHYVFIAQFNYLYARENSSERMRELLEQVNTESYERIPEMIQQGLADGSIRPDFDPELGTAAIENLLAAVSSRLALLINEVPGQFGQDTIAIYQEICRTFLRGLQANPANEEEVH